MDNPARKLTKELADKLAKLVGEGNYVSTAAAACGISRKTFYEWKRRGDEPDEQDPLLRGFSERLALEEAEAERRALATVLNASLDQYTAATWFLERRAPERWAKRTYSHIELESKLDERIAQLCPHMSKEAFGELVSAVETVGQLESEIEEPVGPRASGRKAGSE